MPRSPISKPFRFLDTVQNPVSSNNTVKSFVQATLSSFATAPVSICKCQVCASPTTRMKWDRKVVLKFDTFTVKMFLLLLMLCLNSKSKHALFILLLEFSLSAIKFIEEPTLNSWGPFSNHHLH